MKEEVKGEAVHKRVEARKKNVQAGCMFIGGGNIEGLDLIKGCDCWTGKHFQ